MKKQLTCMIVDDEPLAQNLLEKFILRVPYLTLLAKYDNAIAALEGMGTHIPDIVFLDVQMPEMTGVDFLKSLIAHQSSIILVTAFPQYALDGFEYNAVDYLLKPVAFSRFMKAIQKVVERTRLKTEHEIPSAPPDQEQLPVHDQLQKKFFMVKADKKLIKIALEDILFVEGMKDYIKIHLPDQYVITHMTMTKIESLLPSAQFIRINRSFIIQIAAIKLIEGNMIEVSNGKRLTIGINYRETVKEGLKTWTI